MLTLLLQGSRRVLTVKTVRAVNQSYYSQQMGKRVAVVLAGCGVYDGSEIHEASAVLVHLSRGGASVSSRCDAQVLFTCALHLMECVCWQRSVSL